MPSGMTETQRTVFALVLLTYLCVVVKERAELQRPKVVNPGPLRLGKSFKWKQRISLASLKWWA